MSQSSSSRHSIIREGVSINEVYNICEWQGFSPLKSSTDVTPGVGIQIRKSVVTPLNVPKSGGTPQQTQNGHGKSSSGYSASEYKILNHPVVGENSLIENQHSTGSPESLNDVHSLEKANQQIEVLKSLEQLEEAQVQNGSKSILSSTKTAGGVKPKKGVKLSELGILSNALDLGFKNHSELNVSSSTASEHERESCGVPAKIVRQSSEGSSGESAYGISPAIDFYEQRTSMSSPTRETLNASSQHLFPPDGTPMVGRLRSQRIPSEEEDEGENIEGKPKQRSAHEDSEYESIESENVLFTSTGSSISVFPVIDNPNSVHVIHHPLYNILAIFTNFSLILLSANCLRLIQRLIEPSADAHPDYQSSPTLPIRLQDAPHLFASVSPSATASTTKILRRHPTLSVTEPLDRFLCGAWHRESLTLAMGSSQALMIFKPTEHGRNVLLDQSGSTAYEKELR